MHPVAHPVRLRIIAHLLDVALQRVEVEHQAGGLDVGLVHAGQGGNVVADLELVEIDLFVHEVGSFHWIQGSLSRSTFPPVMMTPTRLPLKASGFLRMVASGTALDGSMTTRRCFQVSFIASTISVSDAV